MAPKLVCLSGGERSQPTSTNFNGASLLTGDAPWIDLAWASVNSSNLPQLQLSPQHHYTPLFITNLPYSSMLSLCGSTRQSGPLPLHPTFIRSSPLHAPTSQPILADSLRQTDCLSAHQTMKLYRIWRNNNNNIDFEIYYQAWVIT